MIGIGIHLGMSGGGWSPRRLGASLSLWLRADMGVTLNGSTVSAWADQSGSGDSNRTATQGTAANQPTFTASDASFNGQPVLSFDGATDYMATGTWSAALTQPSTIYMVERLGAAAGQPFWLDGIGASNRVAVFHATAAAGKATLYAGSSLEDSVAETNSTSVICGVVNGASSALYRNAITTAAASGNAGANTALGLTIGADYTFANKAFGKIAEILVCSGAHSSTQRAQVMNYMGRRYGVTVAA